MELPFVAMKKKRNGLWRWIITDNNTGEYVTSRQQAASAEECIQMLCKGLPTESLPPERLQVLRRLPKLTLSHNPDEFHPYTLKTDSGFTIRRFLLDFHAKWWQEAYMWRRQEHHRAGRTRLKWNEIASMFDELESGQG